MRKLTMAVVAATITAFAAPAFAGGGCGSAAKDKTAEISTPTTTAEAPQTPRPDHGNGS